MRAKFEVNEQAASDEGLEFLVERYLAGELGREETLAFEEALAQPELGGAFREILLIRELLHSAPPHDVPPGLNERIARALEAELLGPLDAAESSLGRRSRIVRDGFAWMVRGPRMAFAGFPGLSRSSDTLELDAPTGAEPRGRAARALASTASATGKLGAWALRRLPRSNSSAPSGVGRLRGAK